jgi:hypothetical protein
MRFVTEMDTSSVDMERPRPHSQSIPCCRLWHLVVSYGLRCYSPNVGVSSRTCMSDGPLPEPVTGCFASLRLTLRKSGEVSGPFHECGF